MTLGKSLGWSGVLALVCAVSVGSPAHAAETTQPSGRAASSPRGREGTALSRVEITTVGDIESSAAARERIASWFAAQGIEVERHHEATLDPRKVLSSTPKQGLRLWIVLDSPITLRIFFAAQERAGDEARYWVQDALLSGVDRELGLERMGNMAYLSAVALWEGNIEASKTDVEQQLGQGAEKSEAAPAAPAAPAEARAPGAPPKAAAKPAPAAQATQPGDHPERKARSGWHGQFKLEIPIESHGPEGTFWGTNFGSGVAYWWPHDFLGVRAYMQMLPFKHELRSADYFLAINELGWRVGPMFGHQLSRELWLFTELLPQYKYTTARTQTLNPDSVPIRDSDYGGGGFGLMGSVGISWDAPHGAFYTLSATLAVPFNRHHYDVPDPTSSSGTQRLASAWVLQPGVTFSVGVF